MIPAISSVLFLSVILLSMLIISCQYKIRKIKYYEIIKNNVKFDKNFKETKENNEIVEYGVSVVLNCKEESLSKKQQKQVNAEFVNIINRYLKEEHQIKTHHDATVFCIRISENNRIKKEFKNDIDETLADNEKDKVLNQSTPTEQMMEISKNSTNRYIAKKIIEDANSKISELQARYIFSPGLIIESIKDLFGIKSK